MPDGRDDGAQGLDGHFEKHHRHLEREADERFGDLHGGRGGLAAATPSQPATYRGGYSRSIVGLAAAGFCQPYRYRVSTRRPVLGCR